MPGPQTFHGFRVSLQGREELLREEAGRTATPVPLYRFGCSKLVFIRLQDVYFAANNVELQLAASLGTLFANRCMRIHRWELIQKPFTGSFWGGVGHVISSRTFSREYVRFFHSLFCRHCLAEPPEPSSGNGESGNKQRSCVQQAKHCAIRLQANGH